MPQTYFFALFLSSSELSQAGSRFTTEGLNEMRAEMGIKTENVPLFPFAGFLC